MLVVIPSAIQVFAWLATMRRGRVQVGHADAVPAGLLRHVHDRRAHRRHAGGAAVRLAGARHPLRRGASALRADRRHALPALRRLLLLGAHGVRPAAVGSARPLGVRAALHGRPRHLPAHAPHRPARYAPPRLHLSRRPRPGMAEFRIERGVGADRGRHCAVPGGCRPPPAGRRQGRRESVERGHAGVAAAWPLRRAQHPARGEP